MASLSARCIAEGVGTALLVYFGAGAAAMTLMLAAGTKPATPFNVGIGQLGGLADWFAIGMSFAIIIAAVIYSLGRVSGAHLNPAVTIALLVTKRFPAGDTIGYIVAQCIGAAIGSLLFFLTVGMDAVTIGGLGATAPFPGIGYGQAILVEAVATFVLMLAIMGVAVDERAPPGFAGTDYRAYRRGDDHGDRQHRRGIAEPGKDLRALPDGLAPRGFESLDILPDIHYRAGDWRGGCGSFL